MRKTEHYHNTPEQVEQYVTQALELVEKVAPPDDLRSAVFAQACALFAGKQIVFEQVGALPNLAIPGDRRH